MLETNWLITVKMMKVTTIEDQKRRKRRRKKRMKHQLTMHHGSSPKMPLSREVEIYKSTRNHWSNSKLHCLQLEITKITPELNNKVQIRAI